MTEADIRSKVHEFIRKNFLFDDHITVKDDQSLLGTGVVDSTGILELIAFLESTCGVKFADSELVADNFDSVDKISSFMAGKLPTPKA
jgi:acyl carrier protein